MTKKSLLSRLMGSESQQGQPSKSIDEEQNAAPQPAPQPAPEPAAGDPRNIRPAAPDQPQQPVEPGLRPAPQHGPRHAPQHRDEAAMQHPQPPSRRPGPGPRDARRDEGKLDDMLARINTLASKSNGAQPSPGDPNSAPAATGSAPASDASKPAPLKDAFVPLEPTSFREAALTDTEVEMLLLKFLLARGDGSGRDMAKQVKLPFNLIEPLLRSLKHDQLIAYKGAAAMNDYICQLTELGRERAKRYSQHCTYFGSAPVSLDDYIRSVKAQSIEEQHPTEDDLRRAFSDLLINKKMFRRLGPAINSGRGMFLFGFPGNGKTSIAERVTEAFGSYIWIPRAIGVDGQIIRLFDPMNHVEAPLDAGEGLYNDSKIDHRWVRIRRPTIIVGGELTMNNLEVAMNEATGINEAPLQLKSNCGTLVIDDFGRQKMSVDELLNRWIVPLEKRYDFLNMSNGKKLQVPFDQLIVFSTNLEPRDLVDDAFLRRIPYKIEVVDPTEEEFRELFRIMCPKMGFRYQQEPIDYLIDTHYKAVARPFRCCQPRDLLLQVRNFCLYHKEKPNLSNEYFDFAAENYFAVM